MKTVLDYIAEFAPAGLEIAEAIPPTGNKCQYKITFRYRGIEQVMYEYDFNCEVYDTVAQFSARRCVVWAMETFAYKLNDSEMIAYWQKSPWYEKRPLSEVMGVI